MARFARKTWSIEVPEGWAVRDDSHCVTLASPGDLDALQISAYLKDSEVLPEDLEDFASEHLSAGAPTALIRVGDYEGFEIAFDEGESFCRQWYLRNGKQMLFVAYNCELDRRGVEDGSIRAALATLSRIGSDDVDRAR